MPKAHRRPRCPACGVWSWPRRLTGDYPLDGVVQIQIGTGRLGKGSGFRYGSRTPLSDTELRLQARMIEKIRGRFMVEARRRGLA